MLVCSRCLFRAAHHLATISLIVGSHYNNFHRMGLCVLFIHDVSDIVIDLLKTFNYLKLENAVR